MEARAGIRATPARGGRFSAHVAAFYCRPAGRGKRPRDRRSGGADAAAPALRQGLRLRHALRRLSCAMPQRSAAEGPGRAAGLHQCPLRRRQGCPFAGGRRGRGRPAAIPLSPQMGRGARSAQGAPARAPCQGAAGHPPRRRPQPVSGRDRSPLRRRVRRRAGAPDGDPRRRRGICPRARHAGRHDPAQIERQAGRQRRA